MIKRVAGKPTTLPEATGTVHAQHRALVDPNHPKDAMFLPPGSPLPPVHPVVQRVARTAGTLLTTNKLKAAAFKSAQTVDDPLISQLLGYPETKAQAGASGRPLVVQAQDSAQRPLHQMLSSPAGLPAALQAARAQVPNGGRTAVLSPLRAIQARALAVSRQRR
jgi:hypothetical protein